jgi:hypothetical protein
VRRGRKAAGLLGKMAELPKDEPAVCSAFLFLQIMILDNHLRQVMKGSILKWPL